MRLGTNSAGGKLALPDWRDIALNGGRRVIVAFDGDVARKPSVQKSCHALAQYLSHRGARVEYLWLPDTDEKTGLDDYLAAHSVEEMWRLVKPTSPPPQRTEKLTPPKPTPPKPTPPKPTPQPTQPVPLDDALEAFGNWLHLDDAAPIIVTAATVVANLATGDPVWLLLVGPPSGGKTEILSSLMRLPYIVPAATITEAALLSGTSKRERAADATGGLLRQVADFGILLAKDFTSVLSQNRDTAKAAMAAMREIYDGRWDRPIGTDGGRTLHLTGKCGFIGGVTPSYDRYQTIVNTLGDRYLLLRLPNVDAEKQARAAIAQAEHEKQMRAELSAAMTGLIAGADTQCVHAPLEEDTVSKLVALASLAARARTDVERDGYSKELLVLPQPEGPARLVKAMLRLYGAMGALGADDNTRWDVLTRIALDCAPAVRVPLMRALLAKDGPCRTSVIASEVGMVTKTAGRVLDDLALLGVAGRSKKSDADNSTNIWVASDWLREHWPQKVGPKSTTRREGEVRDEDLFTEKSDADDAPFTPPRTFRSCFDDRDGICRDCHAKPPAVNGRCAECHIIHVRVMAGYDQ